MEKARLYRNQTKRLILHTYQDLLKEHRFEDISVSDIVKACGISRATFYRYFQDKYDLFFCWSWNYFEELAVGVKSYRELLVQYLNYVLQEKRYFRKVFVENSDRVFSDYCNRQSRTYLEYLIRENTGQQEFSQEELDSVFFFSAGYTQVWMEWVRDGCKDPPELIAERGIANIPASLKKFDYFK